MSKINVKVNLKSRSKKIILNEIFVFNIAKLAVKSIINVGSAYPKPGLITPLDNNALNGTDFETFIDGAMSLFQCFVNCASIGADTESMKPVDVLTMLKSTAKIGVNDSLRATRGKISMKGNVFCLGLLCAAAARLIVQKRFLTPPALALTASSFVNGILERELWNLDYNMEGKILSEGEKVYISYGIEGIRGEAEKGFKLTLKAVESLRKLTATQGQLSLREKLIQTLIAVMAENQDTRIAAHGGIGELMRIQRESQKISDLGCMLTTKGIDKLFEFDKNLRSKCLAPDGSAIILTSALLIRELGNLKLTRSGYDEE